MILVLTLEFNPQSVVLFYQSLVLFVYIFCTLCHDFQSLSQLAFVCLDVLSVVFFLVVLILKFLFVILQILGELHPQMIAVIGKTFLSLILQMLDLHVNVFKKLVQEIDLLWVGLALNLLLLFCMLIKIIYLVGFIFTKMQLYAF